MDEKNQLSNPFSEEYKIAFSHPFPVSETNINEFLSVIDENFLKERYIFLREADISYEGITLPEYSIPIRSWRTHSRDTYIIFIEDERPSVPQGQKYIGFILTKREEVESLINLFTEIDSNLRGTQRQIQRQEEHTAKVERMEAAWEWVKENWRLIFSLIGLNLLVFVGKVIDKFIKIISKSEGLVEQILKHITVFYLCFIMVVNLIVVCLVVRIIFIKLYVK